VDPVVSELLAAIDYNMYATFVRPRSSERA
jgi:hypothetical protein